MRNPNEVCEMTGIENYIEKKMVIQFTADVKGTNTLDQLANFLSRPMQIDVMCDNVLVLTDADGILLGVMKEVA